MNMKKLLLILMAAFLAGGLLAAILAQRYGGAENGMISIAQANQMVDEALRQAELDIRQQLDAEDKIEVAATEKPKEEPVAETAEEPEEVTEEPVEEEKPQEEEPVDDGRVFYRYKVINRPLNYRSGPSKDDPSLGYLTIGSEGYVLDYVEENFSLCVAKDTVAYMHSHYWEVEEIDRSELPEGYLKITAADAGRKVEDVLSGASASVEVTPAGEAGEATETTPDTQDSTQADPGRNEGTGAAGDTTSDNGAAGNTTSGSGTAGSTTSGSGTAGSTTSGSGTAEEAPAGVRMTTQNGVDYTMEPMGQNTEATSLAPSLDEQLANGEITQEEMKERYSELQGQ